MSVSKKKNLGIRADLNRWTVLNNLATKRETSVQKLVDEALDRFYFGESTDGPQEIGLGGEMSKDRRASAHLDSIRGVLAEVTEIEKLAQAALKELQGVLDGASEGSTDPAAAVLRAEAELERVRAIERDYLRNQQDTNEDAERKRPPRGSGQSVAKK